MSRGHQHDFIPAPRFRWLTPAYDFLIRLTTVVKKIDPAKGAVTLAYGLVKALNWSAMTMTFMVKDKALLVR